MGYESLPPLPIPRGRLTQWGPSSSPGTLCPPLIQGIRWYDNPSQIAPGGPQDTPGDPMAGVLGSPGGVWGSFGEPQGAPWGLLRGAKTCHLSDRL
jgi:hypothetical protein